MCLVCIEFAKGKLTVLEAFQNTVEMEDSLPPDHYEEVMNMLTKEWETQSYLDSLDEDLSDNDIYSRIDSKDEIDNPWDEDPEFGPLQYEDDE